MSIQASRKEENATEIQCDYTNGTWVPDKSGPLYNGTSCSTIKENQNCIRHGRPDLGYLYWRWRPNQCGLPRFEPEAFLGLLRNRHLAFIGDSMARNQLESLLCMLSTVSPPELIYRDGEDSHLHIFRRWIIPSHNVTVSSYWSPFLVNGIEKSNEVSYNKLYLDSIHGKWGSDLEGMDMVVLSVGHWFLHPAVYTDGDSVLGCHYCPGLNHTEIGFYDPLRRAIKTTLNSILQKRGGSRGNSINVIVTTFSPHHFEGPWDKAGACPKTEPYKEGEKSLEAMDQQMRDIVIEEVDAIKSHDKKIGRMRLEVLDITKLAYMRPDGHPGPYMNPFPFANGVRERMQNDCVHWCLPGPIDTWNEILLQVMKRWED